MIYLFKAPTLRIFLLFVLLTLCSTLVNAQQWDNWFEDYSWSYEKIYPGKYAYQEVLKFDNDIDEERLKDALSAATPKKVLILKSFKSIPPEIFQLSDIEVLDISWGSFSMEELNDIDQFSQLKALNIFQTAKSYEKEGYTNYENKDKLPASFGSLQRLEYLRLYNNGIVEPIPDAFSNLSQLKHLEIASQPALQLPKSIGNLKNLKVASFYHINQGGENDLPETFFELDQLVSLNLGMIWTEGKDLAAYNWSNLTALQELKLGTYKGTYSKEIPDAVYRLKSLKRFYYPSGRPITKTERSTFKRVNKNVRLIKIK